MVVRFGVSEIEGRFGGERSRNLRCGGIISSVFLGGCEECFWEL